MNRRSFLRALAAGSVAAVIGEAPRVLTGPRAFHSGGIVRAGERVIPLSHGHSSVTILRLNAAKALRSATIVLDLAPRFLESFARKEPVAKRMSMLEVAQAQLDAIEREGSPRLHEGGE